MLPRSAFERTGQAQSPGSDTCARTGATAVSASRKARTSTRAIAGRSPHSFTALNVWGLSPREEHVRRQRRTWDAGVERDQVAEQVPSADPVAALDLLQHRVAAVEEAVAVAERAELAPPDREL